LAVNVEAVATPELLLISVSTLADVLAKVPLGPDPGALKVTETPVAATPELLVKVTDMVGKVVSAVVLRRVVAVVEGLGVKVGVAALAGVTDKPAIANEIARAASTCAVRVCTRSRREREWWRPPEWPYGNESRARVRALENQSQGAPEPHVNICCLSSCE
jgi:endonuclease YncB( thermonuclease family)